MDFLIALRVFAGIYKGYVEERHQTGWRRDCWKRWFSSAELMLKCIWVFQVVRLKISRNESILNISRFPAKQKEETCHVWWSSPSSHEVLWRLNLSSFRNASAEGLGFAGRSFQVWTFRPMWAGSGHVGRSDDQPQGYYHANSPEEGTVWYIE